MMKKTLAVTAAMILACGITFGQTTGDKNKKSQAKKAPASKTELNPQPEPPGAKKTTASPESKVALNPQPLPPGAKGTSKAGKVALNPQPLPPGPPSDVQKKASTKAAQTTTKGATAPTAGTSTPK